MARKRLVFSLSLDPGLVARVDEARGDTSRSVWLERAAEKALGDGAVASASSRPSDWGPMDEVLSKPPKAFVESKAFGSHHPKCACYVCKPPKS